MQMQVPTYARVITEEEEVQMISAVFVLNQNLCEDNLRYFLTRNKNLTAEHEKL